MILITYIGDSLGNPYAIFEPKSNDNTESSKIADFQSAPTYLNTDFFSLLKLVLK